MLLLARLSRLSSSIRCSSSNRQYFLDLKQFYRSTSSPVFMASDPLSSRRTCFVFDKDDSTKILIQMIYEIPSTNVRRKFNMLRSVDDSLSQTIRRLTANIERAAKKETRSAKRRLKQQTDLPLEQKQQSAIVIKVLDEQQQPIDETQTNQHAWSHGRHLLINEQTYNIVYNAPAIVKFRFPDVIMTNTISSALVEIDYGDWEHSLFDWYVADEVKIEENEDPEEMSDDSQWTHVQRGPFCTFTDEHVNKFVRLTCLPRNSSLREGMPGEHRSKNRIISCPYRLPMNKRHQFTKEHFPIDSKDLRLVSYNILANGYASSAGANEIMYPDCPPEFLEHDYRKPLLLREILGYHADLIAIQECDTSFYERELSLVMNANGYLGQMKIKSENVREGEAIFYRANRFRLIDCHDVTLGEYLRNAEHTESLRQRFASVPEIYKSLSERNTALQVLALEPHGRSNEIYLVCNTHLYFHPRADIIRCCQALIGLERINEMKQFYEKQGKTVSVIWSGDFNANVSSLAFQPLFTGALSIDPTHRSYNEDYATLIKDFPYQSPVEFSTYSAYAYTHYKLVFHDVIDHIFFESRRFRFERSIPMPTHEEVTEFQAIPSRLIPSDHLAVVLEVQMIE